MRTSLAICGCLLAAAAGSAGAQQGAGLVPVGKGPVTRVGPGQFRIPVKADLEGSWGFVSEAGGPAENPGEWACPGWPALANGFQSKGPPASVTLPKGAKARMSGAYGVVKDADGTLFFVSRTSFGTVRPVVAPDAAISGLADEKGAIRFSAGGAEHVLQPKRPLNTIYTAAAAAIPVKLDAVIEPAFFEFEHRVTKNGVVTVEHLVKCLG
jgi:hypothetical protein